VPAVYQYLDAAPPAQCRLPIWHRHASIAAVLKDIDRVLDKR